MIAAEHERSALRVYTASFKPNLQLRLIARLRDAQSFSADPSGRLFAAVSKRNLYIGRAGDGSDFSVVSTKHAAALTAVAVSASAGIVAAADASGSIQLWHVLGAADAAPSPPTSLHWHSSSLHALAFSPDGTHMISGGGEGVLVIWQLDTRARNFLPRLGAALLSLSASPDGAHYALGMADNSVRIVETASLATRHTIVGVRQVTLPGAQLDFAHGMALDPKRRAIVLNGLPGGVQFFSAAQDRLIADVDVLQRNLITRSDKGSIAFPRIEHVAFSRDGTWMATVRAAALSAHISKAAAADMSRAVVRTGRSL